MTDEITGPLADIFVDEEEYEQQEKESEEIERIDRQLHGDQVFADAVKNMNQEKKRRMIREKLVVPSTKGFARIDRDNSIDHNNDCKALKYVDEGIWSSPWTFATSEKFGIQDEEWRKELDIKFRNKSQYIVLKCQDRECGAEILVESSDLLKLVPSFSKRNAQTEEKSE